MFCSLLRVLTDVSHVPTGVSGMMFLVMVIYDKEFCGLIKDSRHGRLSFDFVKPLVSKRNSNRKQQPIRLSIQMKSHRPSLLDNFFLLTM